MRDEIPLFFLILFIFSFRLPICGVVELEHGQARVQALEGWRISILLPTLQRQIQDRIACVSPPARVRCGRPVPILPKGGDAAPELGRTYQTGTLPLKIGQTEAENHHHRLKIDEKAWRTY